MHLSELYLNKTDHGTWVGASFRFDSGTEMTTMPASDAKKRDLPIPRRPVPGLMFQGHEVRSGLLRARIVGMDATEYVFPCYFLGDPNGAVAKSRNPVGLTGVINQVRFSFDGTPSVSPARGVLVVKKKWAAYATSADTMAPRNPSAMGQTLTRRRWHESLSQASRKPRPWSTLIAE